MAKPNSSQIGAASGVGCLLIAAFSLWLSVPKAPQPAAIQVNKDENRPKQQARLDWLIEPGPFDALIAP